MDVTVDTAHISTILQNKDTKSCKKSNCIKNAIQKVEKYKKTNEWI